MKFVPPAWWPFRGEEARQLTSLRADRLDGRPVLLATADLPAGEVLSLEWERDDVVCLVDGAWTGKSWVFDGPPEDVEACLFRIRARGGNALRRVAGPQGGHLLASGMWQAGATSRGKSTGTT